MNLTSGDGCDGKRRKEKEIIICTRWVHRCQLEEQRGLTSDYKRFPLPSSLSYFSSLLSRTLRLVGVREKCDEKKNEREDGR